MTSKCPASTKKSPTYLSSFISCNLHWCTRHTKLLVGSFTHPKLSHLCKVAHPSFSSGVPHPHSQGNPSHPSRPSSNVISSMKVLLISSTGCVFLPSMSSNSTFFVPLLSGHFSYSAAISFFLVRLQPLPPTWDFKILEAKTALLTYPQLPA